MNSSDFPVDQNQNQDSSSTSSVGAGRPTTVEKVRNAAAATTAQAKDKVAGLAAEGKNAAADKVAGYSDRLREAARSAEAAEDPNIAHFAGQAADRLERAADYVRDADFNRMREDANQIARRHPALFMGGMLVAGLVLGNLAKASFQSLGESQPEGDGDQDARDRDQGEADGRDLAPSRGEDEGDVFTGRDQGGSTGSEVREPEGEF